MFYFLLTSPSSLYLIIIILVLIISICAVLYFLEFRLISFNEEEKPEFLYHFTTSKNAEKIQLEPNQVHLKMSNKIYSPKGNYFFCTKNINFINRLLCRLQNMDKIIVIKTSDLDEDDLLKTRHKSDAVYLSDYTGPGEIISYDFK